MNVNFAAALDFLRRTSGDNFEVDIANADRPPSNYLFENVLPERRIDDYAASDAYLQILSTMAGLVGMDSPLPPVGSAQSRTWRQESFKIGGYFRFPEQMLRHLQQQSMRLRAGGGDDTRTIANQIINFAKFLRQPLLDTAEFLRGMALQTGGIDWTFNAKRINFTYGVPSGNLFPQRTSTAGYGGTSSVWWDDWYTVQTILKGRIRVAFATPATIQLIIGNPANDIRLTAQDQNTGSASFLQLANPSQDIATSDIRGRASLVAYDASGNVFDLSSGNLGKVIQVPFLNDGYIVVVGGGNQQGNAFMVDGTGDEVRDATGMELGYTHIAPTVEGGPPGRWERVFIPEAEPWALMGQSVMNLVPVLRGVENLVVMRTAMS